ncbi:MAG: glycosyltransferase family 4 protein [Ruminococcaceae bacterium]|nr:glycosyltransferase family 4 protein [Oscillospiraceae bacterium]
MNWDRLFRHGRQKGEKPAIGLVVTGFDKGGLEQVVYNLYLGYRRHGYDTYVLCEKPELAGWFAEQLEDLRHFRIFSANEADFFGFCLKKNIRQLHYHYNTFMMERAASLGIRCTYTIHNVYTWFNDAEMAERRECLEACHGIAAVSSFVKDYFCTRSGMPESRVEVIPNGVDFAELDITEPPPGLATRAALGLAEDDIVIAQVSSINAVKHQIGMVGVMEQLTKQNPRFKLLLAGNVIEPDYNEALLAVIEKSPAKSSIIFVPYFSHRHMGEFLRRHVDIFTLPTLQEGCSNAVLEAMYCQVPMVLTDVGNARDVRDVAACIVTPTAYGDVLKLRPQTTPEYARQKDAANQGALVAAFMQMAENLAGYRAQAGALGAEVLAGLETEAMVQRYLAMMFGPEAR